MKKKPVSYALILLVISVLVRLIVYLLLPPSDSVGRYANASSLYFSAVTDHFADYLSFTTNIPPATTITDACIFGIRGAEQAVVMRLFLVLVFILDSTALLLLFAGAIRMGAKKRTTFWLLLLLSLAMIPFELWRDGMHYDHLTFFFTSFFAWALTGLLANKKNFVSICWVSFSAALLVSQSAANSAVVPFSILAICCCLYLFRKQWIRFLYTAAACLALPVLTLVIIGKKNTVDGQDGMTSNKAGPAMMMVVQRAYAYDSVKVREVAKEAGAPDWYLWAYDHATPPIDSVTGKQAEHWLNLAQAFGICFYTLDGRSNHNPWQFDFSRLTTYLQTNGPAKLLSFVQADAYDAVNRPYRFAGFSPELSPRWIGVYGSISQKIFFATIKRDPLKMGRTFLVQQGVFGLYGPLFLYNTTQSKSSLLAESGLRTLHEKLPLQFLFVVVTLIAALFLLAAYVTALLSLPVSAWRFLRKKIQSAENMDTRQNVLLAIPVACIAAVYSCLVGGENDRYFVQAIPYLVILMPLYAGKVWKDNKKATTAS